MKTRQKAIAILVLVSFLYSNSLWAVDTQVHKLANHSNASKIEELLPQVNTLVLRIRNGEIEKNTLPPGLERLYEIAISRGSSGDLTASEIRDIESFIRTTDITWLREMVLCLVPDRSASVSGERDSGAIGKGSCLAEKDTVAVENLNDAQRGLVMDAIDRIKRDISRAGLTDIERDQALQVVQLLKDYFGREDIRVFDARVKDPEDYLLAFPRARDRIIALARDFVSKDYIIEFIDRLPEILFHEGFAARFGERDYEEHRRIYSGIQRKIFSKDNFLKDELRFYINLKLPGNYNIEFDNATLNDSNINVDKIRELLLNREFLYKTLKRIDTQDVNILSRIRFRSIKVEHGGTGSQKQTLHISFDDENRRRPFGFALKVAINRSAREGFAKGERHEIPTLRQISGDAIIPIFGVYVEEPGNNFYAYTEEWIAGPTAARVMARGRLTKKRLTNIVSSYLSIMRALNTRSSTGGYLAIYDVQTENAMFKSWDSDEAVAVDIGKIIFVNPLFILQEFDRHYSRGNRELHKAIFDGVGDLRFLEEALDRTVSDRREVKGYTREMTIGLAESLKEYIEIEYIKQIAKRIGNGLNNLAVGIFGCLSRHEDAAPIIKEFQLWIERLHEDAQREYMDNMALSNKTRLEMVELIQRSLNLEGLLNVPQGLDLVERLFDMAFLLGRITKENIRFASLPSGERVINPEDYRPEFPMSPWGDHTHPPTDTLDGLELNTEDVYLSLGGGPGINNIAACLRGVRRSIYLDRSEENRRFIEGLKRCYGAIKNSPNLRDRVENQRINNVEYFIREVEQVGTQPIEEPPLDIYIADAANMPLQDNSITKVSILGLFAHIYVQGRDGKVIRAIREVLRVVKVGGLILYRSDTPIEKDLMSYFPDIAAIMGIELRIRRVTPLGSQVFEVMSKRVIGDKTAEDLVEACRADNGKVDPGDLGVLGRVAGEVDRARVPEGQKSGLTAELTTARLTHRVRDLEEAKGRIKEQIDYYYSLKGRIGCDEKMVRNIFIDKGCLPKNQQYILEGDEWARRRQLLERMFPGYRFNVFTGSLGDGMNKDNTIVLTNKDMEIDARLLCITNAGEEEYFPIDALIYLGIGLLNLSRENTPLAATVQNLYWRLTKGYMDINAFLNPNNNYRLNIKLQPIVKFDTELEIYAISLLEQAA